MCTYTHNGFLHCFRLSNSFTRHLCFWGNNERHFPRMLHSGTETLARWLQTKLINHTTMPIKYKYNSNISKKTKKSFSSTKELFHAWETYFLCRFEDLCFVVPFPVYQREPKNFLPYSIMKNLWSIKFLTVFF